MKPVVSVIAARMLMPVVLALSLGGRPAGAVLAAGQQGPVALATPRCTAATPATPSETEGPFYKTGSPLRTSLLEAGVVGTKLMLTGSVLSRGGCALIPGAWLDFWQADARGRYDNAGYRLRGHQLTDSAGRYSLETIVPGLYPGRTRHIHVKVRAPGGPILTTQIYFPNEPGNVADGLFNPALLANVRSGATGITATFDFVIDARAGRTPTTPRAQGAISLIGAVSPPSPHN